MTRTRLDELSIRSLGVIDDAVLELGPRFTAITGETGAGKTMVVQALALLRGQRADSGVIRAGQERAATQGVWRLHDEEAAAIVLDAGGEIDGDELFVARSVSRDRSRAQVGGTSVPAGILQQLADRLVAVHGQSDQQRLRSPAAQRDALDAFAGAPLAEALEGYRAHLDAWQRAERARRTIVDEREARAREADALRQDLDEITAVDPQPGEDDELAALAHRLEHVESLRQQVQHAHAALAGSDAVGDGRDAVALVGSARQIIERAAGDDAELEEARTLLTDADALVAEASTALARYLDGLDAPERSLDDVHERRAQLTSLTRRFGTIDAALEHGRAGALRIAELDDDEARTAALDAEIERQRAAALWRADALTALRRAAATRLASLVETELRALAMPDARLTIAVETSEECLHHGRDDVTLLLAPHPGAEPRPIQKGASGGELSRVMLALEVSLASESVPTLVFDEVDAGVGGASAIEIGKRLARLAEHAQVIVVTHLAQVAAFADRHITVVKGSDGSVTSSSVHEVDGEERLAELARMLSGTASETARAHAAELLADAARNDVG